MIITAPPIIAINASPRNGWENKNDQKTLIKYNTQIASPIIIAIIPVFFMG
jgi:hypothetical protein